MPAQQCCQTCNDGVLPALINPHFKSKNNPTPLLLRRGKLTAFVLWFVTTSPKYKWVLTFHAAQGTNVMGGWGAGLECKVTHLSANHTQYNSKTRPGNSHCTHDFSHLHQWRPRHVSSWSLNSSWLRITVHPLPAFCSCDWLTISDNPT
jgi:hypothetical protein